MHDPSWQLYCITFLCYCQYFILFFYVFIKGEMLANVLTLGAFYQDLFSPLTLIIILIFIRKSTPFYVLISKQSLYIFHNARPGDPNICSMKRNAIKTGKSASTLAPFLPTTECYRQIYTLWVAPLCLAVRWVGFGAESVHTLYFGLSFMSSRLAIGAFG